MKPQESLLRPLRPLLYCLIMIAFCTVFNSITEEKTRQQTPFEIVPEPVDTVLFPYYRHADSLCYDILPGDNRYTDQWCYIASDILNGEDSTETINTPFK